MEASTAVSPIQSFPWSKCVLGCDELPGEKEINFLPCLHVLCSNTCLNKLLWEMEGKGSKPHCKICLRNFTLDHVKRNVKLDDFLKKKVQPEEVILKCGNCIMDDPVESYCLDCQENLCSACTNFHPRLKGKTDHKLDRNVEQRRMDQLEELEKQRKQCTSHVGKMANLFCFTCQKKICEECKPEHGKGHAVLNIADELGSIRSRMNSTKEARGLFTLGVSMLEEKLESLRGPEWRNFVSSLDDIMLRALEMLIQRREALFVEGQKQLVLKVKGIENKIKLLNCAKLDSSSLAKVFEDVSSERMDLDDVGMINVARTALPKSEDLIRIKEFLEECFDNFVEKDESIAIDSEKSLSDLQGFFQRFGSVGFGKPDSRTLDTNDAIVSSKPKTERTPRKDSTNQAASAKACRVTPIKDSGDQLATAKPSKVTPIKNSGDQVASPSPKAATTPMPLTPNKDSTDQMAPSNQGTRRIATKSTAGRLNGRPLGMPHMNHQNRILPLSPVLSRVTPPVKTYPSPNQKANAKKVADENTSKTGSKDDDIDDEEQMEVDQPKRAPKKSDGGESSVSAETEVMSGAELSPEPELEKEKDSEAKNNGDDDASSTSPSSDVRTSKRERKRKVFSDCIDPDDVTADGSPKTRKGARQGPGRPSRKQKKICDDNDDDDQEDSEVSNLMNSGNVNNGSSLGEEPASGRRSSLRRRKAAGKTGDGSSASDASELQSIQRG